MDFQRCTTMPKLTFIGILLAILTFGCHQSTSPDSDPTAPHLVLAKEFFELVRTRNLDYAQTSINPALVKPELQQTLQQLAALFPQEVPRDVKTIGNLVDVHYDTVAGRGTTETWRAHVTFQYEFQNAWLLAGATLSKQAGAIVIDAAQVDPIAGPLDKINSFSFQHKSLTHYAVLAAACVIAVFILAALVTCLRTPLRKRKWLWLIFIALGVGQIALNWTTGDISWKLVNLQLFGTGFLQASPYAAVYLVTSFPLGALIFLVRRNRLISHSAANGGADQTRSRSDPGRDAAAGEGVSAQTLAVNSRDQ